MSTILHYTSNLGFLLHIIFELPACIQFFMLPSRQLGIYTPHAHALMRQYAVLLFSSVLIAGIFVTRPPSEVSAQCAGALATYHVAPALRSIARLQRQIQSKQAVLISEAMLFLVVHSVCGVFLFDHIWTAIQVP
ncbi:hypothetical protein PV10_07124 [Exophiala mesophila]|uniref:Uncharacterized protein n=1 Tax=Exophiala mesophila TaxID=212818 RepID=A0A0D1Z755_EXOME|nr:uncharacterized protein PV10_07124 [Exophiala mesophila]KIV89744.1 hypothetical protein PV10_07124 [Exophiala mesophila]